MSDMEVKMNPITVAALSRLNKQNRESNMPGVAVLIVLVSVVILGHWTTCTMRPLMLHVPVVNLLAGSTLLAIGASIFRRYTRPEAA